jgi:hypothetical protein
VGAFWNCFTDAPKILYIINKTQTSLRSATYEHFHKWCILDGIKYATSRKRLGIFLFTTTSRPVLGPTQPPIQWVSGAPSLWVKRPVVVKLTTYLHLVSRSRMRGAISPLPQYALRAWCLVKVKRGISTVACICNTRFASYIWNMRSMTCKISNNVFSKNTFIWNLSAPFHSYRSVAVVNTKVSNKGNVIVPVTKARREETTRKTLA